MTIEAMKQALEALVGYELVYGSDEKDREAVRALRTSIEAAEKQDVEQSSTESKETFDQPVAWMSSHDVGFKRSEFGDTPTVPLYTAPQPQRERVIFPTMLRKMWSGGEVQAWLDENVNKEKNT